MAFYSGHWTGHYDVYARDCGNGSDGVDVRPSVTDSVTSVGFVEKLGKMFKAAVGANGEFCRIFNR